MFEALNSAKCIIKGKSIHTKPTAAPWRQNVCVVEVNSTAYWNIRSINILFGKMCGLDVNGSGA